MGGTLRSVRIKAGLVVVLLSFAAIAAFPSSVRATGETINGGAAVSGAPSTQIPITDLSISTSGNPTIPVKLLVTSGTLSMTTTTGLTFTGGTTGSTLYFSGSLTDVNAALATLRYTRASTGTDTLEMSLVSNGEVFFPDNNHLYEYVSSTLTWNAAKTAAEGRSKYGATGYLATVTSSSENAFIAARLSNAGWMGASDSVVEGAWRWVTGPENGTQFWSGLGNGSAVGGQYSSWNSNEPNDSGGNEDCAQYLSGGGMWNDLPCSGTTLPGYVVEYGAPGNLPSVASKNVSITTTNTTISGTVYTDSGVTNIGSGKDVTILKNGTAVGTVTTDASGQYSLAGVDLANDDVVTAFLDGETQKGVTVQRNNGASATLNIWQNTLIARSASTSALDMTDLDTANNGDSDIAYIYNDNDPELSINNNANFYVPSGNSVTVPTGGAAGYTRIDGTFTLSSSYWFVTGNVSIAGTITGTNGQLYFGGTGTQTLTQTGTIAVDIIQGMASGSLQFLSNIVITNDRYFSMYDDDSIADCNNYSLTTPNLTFNSGGTYSCSAGDVTVSGGMSMSSASALFDVGSGSVSIGSLSVTAGTFTASTGTTTISENIAVSAGATFSAPSGTVTLNGGTTQAISGDIRFHNLSITDSTNNSTNRQITFADGSDITITGTLTTNGLDSNDRVELASASGAWTLTFSGAGSAYVGDYVEVSNSTVTAVNSSTIALPLDPVNSYNAGGNSGWFGISIAGTTHGTEPGTAAVFTISTNGTNITGSAIPITIAYGGTAQSGSDYTSAMVSLANNANSATLTVPALDDTVVEDTETIMVTVTGASGYTVVSPTNASRNLTSNDSGAINLSAVSGLLAEDAARVISITLNAQPSSDVALDLTSSAPDAIILDKATITFTASNWNVAQVVTATAVRDYEIASGRSSTITAAATSSAPAVWQAATPATLGISVSDNDSAGVTVSPLAQTLAEGASGTAAMTLGTKVSSGTVVITAIPAAGIDMGSGNGVAKDYLFTAGSRELSGPLTITAVDNSTVDGTRAYSIHFAVKSSGDPSYTGLAIPTVLTITVTDNDRALAKTTTAPTTDSTDSTLPEPTTDATPLPAGSSILLNDYTEYGSSGKPVALAAGQVVYFDVIKPTETENHSVTVKAVGDRYVDVTIASTPQNARLFVGETKEFDVDNDRHNDIQITLKGITNGIADMSFKQLGSRASIATPAAQRAWTWWPWAIVVAATSLYIVVRKLKKAEPAKK